MSRLVSYFFIFLLLVPLVSAVYSVNAPGVLYEVKYSVISNGSVALIPLSVSISMTPSTAQTIHWQSSESGTTSSTTTVPTFTS